MDIIAKISLHTETKVALPGGFLALDEKEGRSLIERGFAEPAEKTTEAKTTEPKTDEPDPDILAIIDTIAVLDDSAFGKDGKPRVKALEDVLDRDITKKQRDQAWKRYDSKF